MGELAEAKSTYWQTASIGSKTNHALATGLINPQAPPFATNTEKLAIAALTNVVSNLTDFKSDALPLGLSNGIDWLPVILILSSNTSNKVKRTVSAKLLRLQILLRVEEMLSILSATNNNRHPDWDTDETPISLRMSVYYWLMK